MSHEADPTALTDWAEAYAPYYAPEQPLQEIADDVLGQFNTGVNLLDRTVLEASWPSEDTGLKFRLIRMGERRQETYLLRAYEVGNAREPIVWLRYTENCSVPGASLCTPEWKIRDGPSVRYERMMEGYLRTAPNTTFRHGSTDPVLNHAFWQLTIDQVLADKEVTRRLNQLGGVYRNVQNFTVFNSIVTYIRKQRLGIPLPLVHAGLLERLREMESGADKGPPHTDSIAA